MNIIEVSKGLKEGKKYALPGWGKFHMFAEGNAIYIISIYTEKTMYNLHISELETNEWLEVKEESV